MPFGKRGDPGGRGGQGLGRSGGRGFGRGGFGLGPGGFCICTNPDCDYRIPHERGVPCYTLKCPKCGSPLIREK